MVTVYLVSKYLQYRAGPVLVLFANTIHVLAFHFHLTGSKFVEHASAENLKRTFVSWGAARDWTDAEKGQGEEFLYQSVQCKNVWIPMGDIFAN